MATQSNLDTVNENLVFSKPVKDIKFNPDSVIASSSSDSRIDASDSVISIVDASNSSVSIVDLSNNSSSIIDVSNSIMSIVVDTSKNNISIINTHTDIDTDIDTDANTDTINKKNISFKPLGNETVKFNEPSTMNLIENKKGSNNDNTSNTSNTSVAVAVSKIGDVVEDIAEDLLNSVLDKVKESLGDIGVKPSTLPKIIQFVMEAIEDTPTKGPAQKEFALKVIGSLIEELSESDEKKLLQDTFKSGGIEGTIELVVSASKGELNINQVVDVAVNSCICPVFNFSMSKFNSCRNKSDVKNSVKEIEVEVEVEVEDESK